MFVHTYVWEIHVSIRACRAKEGVGLLAGVCTGALRRPKGVDALELELGQL